jgi:hypothetical protein
MGLIFGSFLRTCQFVAEAFTFARRPNRCGQSSGVLKARQSPGYDGDAKRLADVAAKPVAAKEKGNREGCRCAEARDIGEYDTCPHGCVYCYAVRNRPLALERYKEHDPASEFLFPPPPGVAEEAPAPKRKELPLFDRIDEP